MKEIEKTDQSSVVPYIPPIVEFLTVSVESGFAASTGFGEPGGTPGVVTDPDFEF